MIHAVVAALRANSTESQQVPFDWRDIADILWLATQTLASPSVTYDELDRIASSNLRRIEGPAGEVSNAGLPASTSKAGNTPPTSARPMDTGGTPDQRALLGRADAFDTADERRSGYSPLVFHSSAEDALPGQLAIARALRPFKDRRRARHRNVVDIEATIGHYCGTGVLVPILAPGVDRWFRHVAVVSDTGPTMSLWDETITAFTRILGKEGAFERVSGWQLHHEPGEIAVIDRTGHRYRPAHLADASASTLVLVLSDCVSDMWRDDSIWTALDLWGRLGPTALVHMLPHRLWPATALGAGMVSLSSQRRGDPNRLLRIHRSWWMDDEAVSGFGTPVVTLEEESISNWAHMVMARGDLHVPGVLTAATAEGSAVERPELPPRELVDSFRSNASRQASRLSVLLSAVSVDLSIARVILNQLITDGRQVHLAEVLASGLLAPADTRRPHAFDFVAGAREILQESIAVSDALAVWRTIVPHLEATHGPGTFTLLFTDEPPQDRSSPNQTHTVAAALAARLGLTPAARPVPGAARFDSPAPARPPSGPVATPQPPAGIDLIDDATIVVVPDYLFSEHDSTSEEEILAAIIRGLGRFGDNDVIRRIRRAPGLQDRNPRAIDVAIVTLHHRLSGVGTRESNLDLGLLEAWEAQAEFALADRFSDDATLAALRRYLTDEPNRIRIVDIVRAAIGPRTQLVIGQGVGAVIAYQALTTQSHDTTLVTAGSPVSAPSFRRLLRNLAPRDYNGPRARITWHNIVAPNERLVRIPFQNEPAAQEYIRSRRSAEIAPITHRTDRLVGIDHRDRYLSSEPLAAIILGTCTDLPAWTLGDVVDDEGGGMLSTGLGRARCARFECDHRAADIDKAIAFFDRALGFAPFRIRAEALSDLGCALGMRFDLSDSLADLDQAIDCLREAQALSEENSQATMQARNILLADLLRRRAIRTPHLRDLHEASNIIRQTVENSGPTPESLAVFGRILRLEFERTGHPHSLDRSVEAYQSALSRTSFPDADHADWAAELGAVLLLRFESLQHVEDIEHIIQLAEEITSPRWSFHSKQSSGYELRARAYWQRFQLSGSAADLDEAINLATYLVNRVSHGNERGAWVSRLALMLRDTVEHHGRAPANDLLDLIHSVASDEELTIETRLRAAVSGGSYAATAQLQAQAAALYSAAVQLLPQLKTWPPRNFSVGEIRQIVADAAALALTDYRIPPHTRPATALQLLEHASSVLTSMDLSLPLSYSEAVLARQHRDMVQRHERLREQLHSDGIGGNRTFIERMLAEQAESIRKIKGFEEFGRPVSIEHLYRLGDEAGVPVIAFNVSEFGSAAIIVNGRDIRAVPLPSLHLGQALDYANHASADSGRPASEGFLEEMLEWLWHCAVHPVLSSLGVEPHDTREASGPRVWWIRTGILGALPLHAAGPRGTAANTLDYVVSSFIPSLDILGIVGRDVAYHRGRPAAGPALLFDYRSDVHQQRSSPLEYRAVVTTIPEYQGVTVVPPAPLLGESDSPGRDLSPEQVLPEVERAAVAHFVTKVPVDSSEIVNYFCIAERPHSKRRHPALVFVPSERTSPKYYDGKQYLPLYFALLLAGFPYVCTALWTVADFAAAESAELFYKRLRTMEGTFAVHHAARIMNDVAREMRARYPETPSVWAGYAHFGA